ncbi:MAG: uncharacterized protein JWN15_4128 [Firmicutes bacterium]|nr:uncharacterized protein [Bacillota bacterium]
MGTSRSSGQVTSLDKLLAQADVDTLRGLAQHLYKDQPAVQRQCLDFLRQRVPLARKQLRDAAGEAVLLLWGEAESYLAEECWDTGAEQAADLLSDLAERLVSERVPRLVRRSIIDEAVIYIGRTDLADGVCDVVYAACCNDEDLRYLAERLEGLNRESPLEHARRIYRRLGDREKYLLLRTSNMVYGGDYYDLAMFYAEAGETDHALVVAKEGLQKGQGRLEDLRRFLAEHALQAGDRDTYLDLQFQQAIDRLTVQSYQDFRRLCTDSEWIDYESRLMAAMARVRPEERFKLHLLRGEDERAVTILSALPDPRWYDDSGLLTAAASLEKRFPEQVLAFYRKGLGDVTSAHERKEYADKAKVLLKMRHMWVEVMGQPMAWKQFGRHVKLVNHRRPALQEEFGRVIPDWNTL